MAARQNFATNGTIHSGNLTRTSEPDMTLRLKPILLSTTLAALALAPVTVVTTLATADVAWANNGKGNGGGNGNAGGNKDRGGKSEKSASKGGKPAWAGQGGNGKSQQARGGKDPVGNFLKKLTGQDKQEERAARLAARRAPTEFAPTVSKSPGKRPARFSDMHPSDLGNMNGALNANINAVLAHVRNGNTNGPVGHVAMLAVADANLAEANRTLALNDDFVALQDALDASPYASVAEYYAAIDADPTLAIEDLDMAIEDLGGDVATRLDIGVEPPSPEAVAAAEADLPLLEAAQFDAVAKTADYWNKNPDGSPNLVPEDLSPEELELIDDLRDRLIGYENEIAAAIEASEERALSGDAYDDDFEDDAAELPEGDEVCDAGEVCEEEQALLSE